MTEFYIIFEIESRYFIIMIVSKNKDLICIHLEKKLIIHIYINFLKKWNFKILIFLEILQKLIFQCLKFKEKKRKY